MMYRLTLLAGFFLAVRWTVPFSFVFLVFFVTTLCVDFFAFKSVQFSRGKKQITAGQPESNVLVNTALERLMKTKS